MFRKDYLLRPLQQLLHEITSKFSHINVEKFNDLDLVLDDMYRKYLEKNRNYFIEKDIEEIITDATISLDKKQLLATLFYRDALLQKNIELQKLLLTKAVKLFKHIDNLSTIYSLERVNTINEISNNIALLKHGLTPY